MVTATWVRHLVLGPSVSRHFPPDTLAAIGQAIGRAEEGHRGEICFAVEGRWSLAELWRWKSPRARATAAFAELRVWDTEENTGVLIYVLLAEHAIEIVADRGVAARVDDAEWAVICRLIRDRYAAGEYLQGSIAGIEAIAAILRSHFPASDRPDRNELPNRPMVL